ncbi:hypothetical protein P7C70_g9373, partial [Phenoliferia sp. Uapishka_3]
MAEAGPSVARAAPLKISFKLGGTGGPSITSNPSTLASPQASLSALPTPSSPGSEAMEYSFSADPSEHSDASSQVPMDTKPSTVGGLLSAVKGAEVLPKEKPKRKRAPKRPPGEPGPGKHWRKGLKGCVMCDAGDATGALNIVSPYAPIAQKSCWNRRESYG